MSDICASTLLSTGWLKPRELIDLPRDRWRTVLIEEMARRGVGDSRELRARLNSELALATHIHLHLRDVGVEPHELAAMPPRARRGALLAEFHQRRGAPVESMRYCDDQRLLHIAASEYLRERLGSLVERLENVRGAAPVTYGLVDGDGRSMDALKVLPLTAGDYLGIYHTHVDDAFRLQVAHSDNLLSWSRIAELGSHSHQGDINLLGDGFLVANEQDEPRSGNHLRLRYFESLTQLMANAPLYDKSIPRTLSRLNEGTPDIRSIDGNSPDTSVILVGFHFYRRSGITRKVDRLAAGVMSGFERWISWVDVPANNALTDMGFKGNIGSRSSFLWDRAAWQIQEAQLRWRDWSSWRVLVGNGRAYIQLEPRTPGASTSFANPFLTQLSHSRYAAAFFLPRQGNVPGEEGELVYGFTCP